MLSKKQISFFTGIGIFLVLIISIIAISITGMFESADAASISSFTEGIFLIAQGQAELIIQNSIIIDQNDIIITLLKNNKNIYHPQLTERYDIITPGDQKCDVYDRVEMIIKNGFPCSGYTHPIDEIINQFTEGNIKKP